MVNEGNRRQESLGAPGRTLVAPICVARSSSRTRPVVTTLLFHAAPPPLDSHTEALWRVAVVPKEEPVPPHDIERLQVDTVVHAADEDMQATAEALATIFSQPQYIGLDLNDVLAVATGKAKAGKALVLAGTAYDAMTAPVRRWLDTMGGHGYDAQSLLIAQLLQPADEPALDLSSFSGFCDAVLATCSVENGLITACGDAKATMVALLAFGDAA